MPQLVPCIDGINSICGEHRGRGCDPFGESNACTKIILGLHKPECWDWCMTKRSPWMVTVPECTRYLHFSLTSATASMVDGRSAVQISPSISLTIVLAKQLCN